MKTHFFIAGLLLVTGCPQSQNTSTTSLTCASGAYPFVGCWKTTDCKQARDGNNVPINTWFLSEYEITPASATNNAINIVNYTYADSSCTGLAQRVPVSTTDLTLTYDGTNVAQTTTSGGLSGYTVQVTDTNPATATTVTAGKTLVVTGGQLCTSNTFTLGSGYIVFSPSTVSETDFSNCLDPVTP